MNALQKCFLILLILSSFVCKNVKATAYYSIANGAWNGTTNWSYTSGGSSCNCSPTSADTVTINHYITMSWDLIDQGSSHNAIKSVLTINAGATLDGGSTYSLDVNSTGSLYLCGTLIVLNETYSNGSYIYECPTGNLTINGNLTNKNNSNLVFINGSVTVKGTFENGVGGGGSTTVINLGSGGQINVIGGYINNGSILCGATLVSCPGNNPCDLNCASVLPVELLKFIGLYDGGQVSLSWTTASEINNDYFEVQRAFSNNNEAGLTWQTIGTVKGAGNSSIALNYQFTDASPFALSAQADGLVYYKLDQVDYDGTLHNFPLIAVQVKDVKEDIRIYPNPSDGNDISLFYSGYITQPCEIHFYNLNGQEIFYQNSLVLHSGFNRITGNFNSLAKGTYFISLIFPDAKAGSAGELHQKLVIIN